MEQFKAAMPEQSIWTGMAGLSAEAQARIGVGGRALWFGLVSCKTSLSLLGVSANPEV